MYYAVRTLLLLLQAAAAVSVIATASREGSNSTTVGGSCCCHRLPTPRILLCIMLRKGALSARHCVRKKGRKKKTRSGPKKQRHQHQRDPRQSSSSKFLLSCPLRLHRAHRVSFSAKAALPAFISCIQKNEWKPSKSCS